MSADTKGPASLPAEDAARIHLFDTTMDVALAEGKDLWHAHADALRAVVTQDRILQAAGPEQTGKDPDAWPFA